MGMEERALEPKARVRGVLLPADGAGDLEVLEEEGGDVVPFWLLLLFFWALARRRRRNCSLFIFAVEMGYRVSVRDCCGGIVMQEEKRIGKGDDDGKMRMMDGPALGVEARGWRKSGVWLRLRSASGSGKWNRWWNQELAGRLLKWTAVTGPRIKACRGSSRSSHVHRIWKVPNAELPLNHISVTFSFQV